MLPERTDVLVVGAGPTGLAVAATLAGRGVDVTVVDRLARPPVTSRAAVVHAYTLEELDRIGAAAPLVARGHARRRGSPCGTGTGCCSPSRSARCRPATRTR